MGGHGITLPGGGFDNPTNNGPFGRTSPPGAALNRIIRDPALMVGGAAFLFLAGQYITDMDYTPDQVDVFEAPGQTIEQGIQSIHNQVANAGAYVSPQMLQNAAEAELALRNYAVGYYNANGVAPPIMLGGSDQAALTALQNEHMNGVLNSRWDRTGLHNHLSEYAEHWDIDFEDIPGDQYEQIASTNDFNAVQPAAAVAAKPALPNNGTDGLRVTDVLAAAALACTHLACSQPVTDGFGGGAHVCMSQPVGDGLDSHHMPADSISPLPRPMGPAIRMNPADHQRTSSWGSSTAAKAYRARQLGYTSTGNLTAAFELDVLDLQRQGLGAKYTQSIQQARNYLRCIITASGGLLR